MSASGPSQHVDTEPPSQGVDREPAAESRGHVSVMGLVIATPTDTQ